MGATCKRKLPVIVALIILGILLLSSCPVVEKILNADYGVYGKSRYSDAEYAPANLKK